ncbi:MAG: phosphotransferase [Planctomycetota bacterium]
MSGAAVWRADCGHGHWAVRAWPLVGPAPGRVRWIHRVLLHAADRGLGSVPAPLVSDGGDTLLRVDGRWWEVAPWMPGVAVDPVTDGGDAAEEKLLAACRTLAAFHAAVRDVPPYPGRVPSPPRGAAPALLRRAELLASVAATDWRAVARSAVPAVQGAGGAAATASMLTDIADALLREIARAQAEVTGAIEACGPGPVQAIVGDARREHFLFTGQRVTGLVDFGAMAFDTPAVDYARLLGDWAGGDARLWHAALASTGLTPGQQRMVGPLDTSGVVLACCNWLRWIASGTPPAWTRLSELRTRLRSLASDGHPLRLDA